MIVLEAMEGRRHFSVSVTEGYPGFYDVQGDSAADTIRISVDQENETFTLDDVTYTGVAYIFVDGGDGNDIITVLASTVGYIGTSVVAGDGDDDVAVNFDGAIWGGAGNDLIYLVDSFRGEVYGEGNDDQIVISGACVDAEVDGGNGDDFIDATNNHYGAYLRGGNGNDVIYGSAYDDTIWGGHGSDTINAGAGNDVLNMGDGGQDDIDGGDGDDWLYGDSSEGSVVSVEHLS
jgi:hypothetical protein